MTTKLALTINADELEDLMQTYIAECWNGREFTMPLTLSGLLLWVRNKQKENRDEQRTDESASSIERSQETY